MDKYHDGVACIKSITVHITSLTWTSIMMVLRIYQVYNCSCHSINMDKYHDGVAYMKSISYNCSCHSRNMDK